MQGRMVANANAPRTLNTAGFRGQRGVFAGINALTADKEALAKAQQMIAQGVEPAKVWHETGWGQGADGKWRFEIDDSKARLRDYQFTPKDAYEYAKRNAFISGDEQMINRAKSMGEYASMTKAQLRDEYKRTGNEIVDAAINGDIEKAKLLSEKRSGLDSLLSQMSNREYGKASSFIAHGDLGQAYPDAYKIHTRISPEDVGTASAHYNKGNDFQSERIVMGRKPIFESDKSTMLHELQHAIQQREGFARGGNPEQFKGIVKDPYEWYQRLAGEVEARMTQNRMNLDAQQRRDIYPFAVGRYGYEDIPKDKQIINFDNNKAMSQKPLTEFEQAHATAQRNATLPVEKGGLGLPADNAPRTLNTGYMGQRGAVGLTNDFDNSDEIKIIADYLGQSPESMLVNRDLYTKKQGAINSLVSRYEQMDDFSGAYYPTSYGYISISPSAKSNGQWQLTSFDHKMNPLSDQGEMPKNKALTEFFKTIKPNKYGKKSQGNQ
jgi:hypothetical protein